MDGCFYSIICDATEQSSYICCCINETGKHYTLYTHTYLKQYKHENICMESIQISIQFYNSVELTDLRLKVYGKQNKTKNTIYVGKKNEYQSGVQSLLLLFKSKKCAEISIADKLLKRLHIIALRIGVKMDGIFNLLYTV